MAERELKLRSAADLREEFDSAFAKAFASGIVEGEEGIIVVVVAGRRHAVRAADVVSATTDKHVESLARRVPPFVGLAYSHGTLVPVYDLAHVLFGTTSSRARCLMFVEGPVLAAFASDGIERMARVRVEPRDGEAFVRGSVSVADESLPLIDLKSVSRAVVVVAAKERSKGSMG